jgi:hypothetical protein
MMCVSGSPAEPLPNGRTKVDPSGKTSLASNRTIAAAARKYFGRSLIFWISLSFNAEVVATRTDHYRLIASA